MVTLDDFLKCLYAYWQSFQLSLLHDIQMYGGYYGHKFRYKSRYLILCDGKKSVPSLSLWLGCEAGGGAAWMLHISFRRCLNGI